MQERQERRKFQPLVEEQKEQAALMEKTIQAEEVQRLEQHYESLASSRLSRHPDCEALIARSWIRFLKAEASFLSRHHVSYKEFV